MVSVGKQKCSAMLLIVFTLIKMAILTSARWEASMEHCPEEVPQRAGYNCSLMLEHELELGQPYNYSMYLDLIDAGDTRENLTKQWYKVYATNRMSNGNPSLLNVTLMVDYTQSSSIYMTLSGRPICNVSQCANDESNNGYWPDPDTSFDALRITTYNTYGTYFQEQLNSREITNAGVFEDCGCHGYSSSTMAQDQLWYFEVDITHLNQFSGGYTVIVDLVDACPNNGTWDDVLGACRCADNRPLLDNWFGENCVIELENGVSFTYTGATGEYRVHSNTLYSSWLWYGLDEFMGEQQYYYLPAPHDDYTGDPTISEPYVFDLKIHSSVQDTSGSTYLEVFTRRDCHDEAICNQHWPRDGSSYVGYAKYYDRQLRLYNDGIANSPAHHMISSFSDQGSCCHYYDLDSNYSGMYISFDTTLQPLYPDFIDYTFTAQWFPMCNGHGTYTFDPNNPCICDDGWSGTECEPYNGASQRPCCTIHVAEIEMDTPTVVTVGSSGSVYNRTRWVEVSLSENDKNFTNGYDYRVEYEIIGGHCLEASTFSTLTFDIVPACDMAECDLQDWRFTRDNSLDYNRWSPYDTGLYQNTLAVYSGSWQLSVQNENVRTVNSASSIWSPGDTCGCTSDTDILQEQRLYIRARSSLHECDVQITVEKNLALYPDGTCPGGLESIRRSTNTWSCACDPVTSPGPNTQSIVVTGDTCTRQNITARAGGDVYSLPPYGHEITLRAPEYEETYEKGSTLFHWEKSGNGECSSVTVQVRMECGHGTASETCAGETRLHEDFFPQTDQWDFFWNAETRKAYMMESYQGTDTVDGYIDEAYDIMWFDRCSCTNAESTTNNIYPRSFEFTFRNDHWSNNCNFIFSQEYDIEYEVESQVVCDYPCANAAPCVIKNLTDAMVQIGCECTTGSGVYCAGSVSTTPEEIPAVEIKEMFNRAPVRFGFNQGEEQWYEFKVSPSNEEITFRVNFETSLIFDDIYPTPVDEYFNSDCEDLDTSGNCGGWASSGECEANPSYMLVYCASSCGSCISSETYGDLCVDSTRDCLSQLDPNSYADLDDIDCSTFLYNSFVYPALTQSDCKWTCNINNCRGSIGKYFENRGVVLMARLGELPPQVPTEFIIEAGLDGVEMSSFPSKVNGSAINQNRNIFTVSVDTNASALTERDGSTAQYLALEYVQKSVSDVFVIPVEPEVPDTGPDGKTLYVTEHATLYIQVIPYGTYSSRDEEDRVFSMEFTLVDSLGDSVVVIAGASMAVTLLVLIGCIFYRGPNGCINWIFSGSDYHKEVKAKNVENMDKIDQILAMPAVKPVDTITMEEAFKTPDATVTSFPNAPSMSTFTSPQADPNDVRVNNFVAPGAVAGVGLSKKKKKKNKKKRKKDEKRLDALLDGDQDLDDDDDEEENKFFAGIGWFIGGLLAVLVFVLFDLLKYLFNVALIHSSFSGVVNVAPLEKVFTIIDDFFSNFNLNFFAQYYEIAQQWFRYLDVLEQFSASWNCGGSLSMLGPVILIVGTVMLVMLLARETLLRFAIATQARKTESFIKQRVYALFSTAATTALLYLLQSGVMTLMQVVTSIWALKRSCSDLDYDVLQVGSVLAVITVTLFIYFAVLLFAGSKIVIDKYDKLGTFKQLTFGWILSALRLLQVSIGVWTDSVIVNFKILAKAEQFDGDDDDLDNQREKAMSITGQSRGIIWLPLPYGVILTKLAEASNISPALVRSSQELDLYNPPLKRVILWMLNIIKVAMTFLITLYPQMSVVYLTGICMLLGGLVSVFYPNDKQKQEKIILKQIKKQEEEKEKLRNEMQRLERVAHHEKLRMEYEAKNAKLAEKKQREEDRAAKKIQKQWRKNQRFVEGKSRRKSRKSRKSKMIKPENDGDILDDTTVDMKLDDGAADLDVDNQSVEALEKRISMLEAEANNATAVPGMITVHEEP